ncbi:MAG TPA: hypothetical protein VHK01_13640 [Lacipirellulaceae bacterium]|nr:hypothetical protein [Lacipirellulaceae bacterium]
MQNSSSVEMLVNVRSGLVGTIVLLTAFQVCKAELTGLESPWVRSDWFEEQSFYSVTFEPAVRIYINAPLGQTDEPPRATRIVVYALPNGNTIEQTLGCTLANGMDWHYDIQHIAAQVRLLRSLLPEERIVLICAEAGGLSWPKFRSSHPKANETIAEMVDEWQRRFGSDRAKITLTGHSGGGSFMFGVIEAVDEIPAAIDRIAFLDANYAFEAARHTEKLQRWIAGDAARRLIVLAYDDREIVLDGKKVVGPTGGTFRATHRMREAFRPQFNLTETQGKIFHEFTGLDGRIHFYVHPNPKNKILHTALVGDMNGLIHIQTLGTPNEEIWGKFGGPRAYTKWIQPQPTSDLQSTDPATERTPPATSKQQRLPARPENAVTGRKFCREIVNLSLDDREAAILREITRGNFPGFLRNFKTVSISGRMSDAGGEREVVASIDVMPDYLAVGSDDDFVRMPMTPQTAQRIADVFGCILPTRKIVDAIDAHAELHLEPRRLTRKREAIVTFLQHHEIIEGQREGKPRGMLVVGIKKDIVLSPRIFERPNRLAIYGWRQLDGWPIQPLTIVHSNRYVDYSHGVRLVRNSIEINGKTWKIDELLADSKRCGLVSDEGPMNPPAYPLD